MARVSASLRVCADISTFPWLVSLYPHTHRAMERQRRYELLLTGKKSEETFDLILQRHWGCQVERKDGYTSIRDSQDV